MPSEQDGWRRLHPYTLIFALARHAYASRAVLVPAFIALVLSQRRASSGGWQDFQGWLLLPVPLLLLYELVQYFTLAYRFTEHDVVVTRGLWWKRERHIPYARVQNIELVQHWGHRLAGVAKVRLDTGTGTDADAELDVLSLDAVAELREAVRVGRRDGTVTPADVTAAGARAEAATLVALDLRELALHGLLTARGSLVIGAIIGALWQVDLDRWGLGRYLPSWTGLWRDVIGASPTVAVEIAIGVLLLILLFRVLSAAWSVVKHFGFSLTLRGEELFQAYGLLTRIGRTIPRARIQKLTISDAPLLRLFGRATMAVDTAGSAAEREKQAAFLGSHVLVPIVPAARVPTLVRDVYPTGTVLDLPAFDALDWQDVDPRAFRRLVRVRIVVAALVALAAYGALGRWALLVFPVAATLLAAQAWVATRFTTYAWSGDTLIFRSGAWARYVTLVRAGRMQVVSIEQSPLDRRWRMARVHVDTAGAAAGGHHVRIPWLPDDVAHALYVRLRHAAAP